VDPHDFAWTDAAWRGIPLEHTVLYELHVGTFTPAGTFQGVMQRLPYLRDLGVTALQLMPVADFPGDRNWGYDGVALFAPARCYGQPNELRALVDAAHALGMSIHLDVVYNHFGPDGAYHTVFSPYYVSATHRSPWGHTFNFDGPGSRAVRDYVVENALRWIGEYHIDGLRLDATHAIVDDSPRPIVAELAAAAREAGEAAGRHVLVIAEDARNLRTVLEREPNGWGADGVWSDDFHHEVRRALAGDSDGYFADFSGSAEDIASTARRGWYYCGQPSRYFGGLRGTDATGISLERFVVFLQNHDQVGNRALGDRLHHTIDVATWRAASVLLLVLPETPLLFMGQEWGASTPFQFFSDHHSELGEAVTSGRRQEFSRFAAFADPAKWAAIPDPQDPKTFHASCLLWGELDREPHRALLRLYRRLLELRAGEAALRAREVSGGVDVHALDNDVILVRRSRQGVSPVLAVVRLRGSGSVDLHGHAAARLPPARAWRVLLSTEDPPFAPDPVAAAVDSDGPVISLSRAGGVLLRAAEPR
jgi:maltooligosyltrehalose trehalohydrolase